MPDFDLDQLAALIAERASCSTRACRNARRNSARRRPKPLSLRCPATTAPSSRKAPDLLYHLLVVLEARGVKLKDVYAELERRTARVRARGKGVTQERLTARTKMEKKIEDGLSPYRVFTRAEWAARREDTPMTLTQKEIDELKAFNDQLSMSEVEEIYLPLSRLLSMYVAAMQRLFRAMQRFSAPRTRKCPTSSALAARSPAENRRPRAFCRRCSRAGRHSRRSISSPPPTDFCCRTRFWSGKA